MKVQTELRNLAIRKVTVHPCCIKVTYLCVGVLPMKNGIIFNCKADSWIWTERTAKLQHSLKSIS